MTQMGTTSFAALRTSGTPQNDDGMPAATMCAEPHSAAQARKQNNLLYFPLPPRIHPGCACQWRGCSSCQRCVHRVLSGTTFSWSAEVSWAGCWPPVQHWAWLRDTSVISSNTAQVGTGKLSGHCRVSRDFLPKVYYRVRLSEGFAPWKLWLFGSFHWPLQFWEHLEWPRSFFLRNKGSAQNQLFPSWGDVENYHWPMCVNPWELQFLVCSVSHGVSFPSLPTPAWGAGSHCCRSYRIPCPAACSGTFLFNINMPLCKAPSDKTGLRAFEKYEAGLQHKHSKRVTSSAQGALWVQLWLFSDIHPLLLVHSSKWKYTMWLIIFGIIFYSLTLKHCCVSYGYLSSLPSCWWVLLLKWSEGWTFVFQRYLNSVFI